MLNGETVALVPATEGWVARYDNRTCPVVAWALVSRYDEDGGETEVYEGVILYNGLPRLAGSAKGLIGYERDVRWWA
ncbi:MAG: hypothetical protein M3P49_09970 [Actinomycetota bacterium]|nr:hypothetical protein [Actinomycetota bacterium]